MRVLPRLIVIAMVVGACAPLGSAMPTGSSPTTSLVPTSSFDPTPSGGIDADVPTYRGDAARDGVMPGPGPIGSPRLVWQVNLSGPVGTSIVTAGGTAFVAVQDGTLVALDLGTGTQRWTSAVSTSALSTPDVIDSLVVVGTGIDGLQAVDAATGQKRWSIAADGSIPGAPADADGMIIFATDRGTVEAADAMTGTEAWTASVDDAVIGSVAIADGNVVVSTNGGDVRHGSLIALDLKTGAQRWRTDVGYFGRVGTPGIGAGRVLDSTGLDTGVPSSHHIVAVDLATGALDWAFANATDDPVYTPAISGDQAFIPGEDHTLTRVDAVTGSVGWTFSADGVVEVVPALAGNVVYAASNSGSAFAVDRVTGAELWSVPIRGVPYGPTVAGGMLLIGTDLGIVYAIGGTLP
jgi:outer membrane protein assembly factor BamB